MKFLLPNKFKRVGAIIAPLGFALWLCMQLGYINRILFLVFGENTQSQNETPYYLVNATIAIVSFFSFLGGIYFITFSKEKVEDEMVQRIRLDSFQFAALIQIVFIIIGFLCILFFGDPSEGDLMFFFIAIIFLFWLSFIGRFNYVLHIKLKS